MCRFLGYAPEELKAMSVEQIYNLVHPEDRAPFFARFRDRFEGKPRPSNFEGRGIRKDGTLVWLEAASVRVEYNGKPAVQATFLDITERKKSEEALRESENRFRTLFEQSPAAIEVYDKIGFQVQANRAWEKLWGVPRERTLGICNILQKNASRANGRHTLGKHMQER
jgi:PAS domain S-box-containing protein